MKKEVVEEAVRKISAVREAVAGSNVKEISDVIAMIDEALAFIEKHTKNVEHDMQAWYMLKVLSYSRDELRAVKDYGERLSIDARLCDLLNRLMRLDLSTRKEVLL